MGETLSKILEGAAKTKNITAYLRTQSSFYPKIYSEKINDAFYLSTVLRVNRNVIWYDIHHVESYIGDNEMAYKRLIEAVYFTMLFFVPGEIIPKSNIQVLEQDRVENDYPHIKSLNKQ